MPGETRLQLWHLEDQHEPSGGVAKHLSADLAPFPEASTAIVVVLTKDVRERYEENRS